MTARRDAAREGFRLERIRNAVAEALELTLLPGLADPELRDLHVFHVEVARGLASINVLLTSENAPCAERSRESVAAALKRAEPHVRAALAEMLLIKKMPSLTLRVLG